MVILMAIIDLSNIPRNGTHYDWKNSINKTCDFEFGKHKGTLTIIDYQVIGKNSQVKIKYNDIEDWIPTSQLKRGGIGGKLKFFTSDYYYNIGDILHCNTDIEIISREIRRENERNRKYYTYKCLACGEINTTTEAILKEYKGCPYCAGRIVRKGINDITVTAPWMIPFFENEEEASKYTYGSMKEIFPYCPVCRKQVNKKISISHLYTGHRSGCTCDTYMSFPEQVMYNLLLQNDIKFIHRVTKKELSWAKNFEYDFYLPEYQIIIETHGLQHYDEHGFSNLGGKTLQEQQEIDKEKQKLAENNNIKYYIIDCRYSKLNYILNNIINSPLYNDLKLIIKDENRLYDNILIYKKNRLKILLQEQKYTTTDILKALHISLPTFNTLMNQLRGEGFA